MKIGMIGLGKMGANMVRLLRRGDHKVVVWDRNPQTTAAVAREEGVVAADNLVDLCGKLDSPRTIWCMVPAGAATEQTLEILEDNLEAGDIVVDGGNSYFKDSQARARRLDGKGIHLLDAGTSGGIWGLDEGYCLMVGGDMQAFSRLEPVLSTLAPPHGYAHVGPSGAGHYVKMVHNGIEYALMQAYAEGFELLKTSPFGVDLARVADLWNQGSVIRSWLLELTHDALKKNPDLQGVGAWVADSGEGRWTVLDAVENAVAAPTITLALFQRFASRRKEAFSLKMLAALRNEFGGHAIKTEKE
ncbi:MAG: phosphogluconate dehydrogenase (NAD(+)-dependent, decarboxylating) [Acidobacteriota bacterium]